MSSPRADRIAALIEAVLKRHRKHTAAELAATLGVDDTYVGKLRRGWRPTRVRLDLWNRLLSLEAETRPGRRAEPAMAAGTIPEGMDPVTWAAAQFDLLSRMAGSASATLVHYRRGEDFTLEELGEIGGAVLQGEEPRDSAPAKRVSGG